MGVVQVPHEAVLGHQVREVRGRGGAGPEHLDSHLDNHHHYQYHHHHHHGSSLGHHLDAALEAANVEGRGRYHAAKLSLTQQLSKLEILTGVLELLVNLLKLRLPELSLIILTYQEMVMICY